ncbi:MAG: hypothetical protein SGBAC_007161 [Bacillariaceae sp.]
MTLFPYKLHELLGEMQDNAHLSSIISWMPSGNAFTIHQPELFEVVLLQKYFPRQTQINSFKRQLLYYGFDNLGDGIFAHPCFLKDKRHLCGQITHTNPTKSQREAHASIHSRRVRGKRAKQALRQSLAKGAKAEKNSKKGRTSPSLPAGMQPAALSQVGATPLAPTETLTSHPSPPMPSPVMMNDVQNRSSLQQMLLQAHDKPKRYWDRLNMPFMPATTPAEFTLSTLVLAKNKGLPLAQVANMFPMNVNEAGLQAPSMRYQMPQPYAATSSSRMVQVPPSA